MTFLFAYYNNLESTQFQHTLNLIDAAELMMAGWYILSIDAVHCT